MVAHCWSNVLPADHASHASAVAGIVRVHRAAMAGEKKQTRRGEKEATTRRRFAPFVLGSDFASAAGAGCTVAARVRRAYGLRGNELPGTLAAGGRDGRT